MTRRERLERRAERRREWAEKAASRSEAAFDRARGIADGIPMGQPILTGHHSEGRARRDAERIRSGMDKGCAERDKASRHDRAADGIERQLETSVYFDDDDAVGRLGARISAREAEAELCKAVNRIWRREAKKDGLGWEARLQAMLDRKELSPERAASIARTLRLCDWIDVPYPAYHIKNLRASITRDKKRIEELRRRDRKAERAAGSEHGVVVDGDEYVTVTFAEKPDRGVLSSLRDAGFRWSGGSWHGRRDRIPGPVADMLDGEV